MSVLDQVDVNANKYLNNDNKKKENRFAPERIKLTIEQFIEKTSINEFLLKVENIYPELNKSPRKIIKAEKLFFILE